MKNNFDILKTQIATSIRNRRYQKKQALMKSAVPSKKHPLVICSTTHTPGSSEVSKQSEGLNSKKDVVEAEAALKKCSSSDESLHVKQLLRETYSVRRLWIEKDATNIKEIIEKCPQLNIHSLIMQEFCQIKDKNEALLYNSMDKLILKLGSYFEINIFDETSKVEILLTVHEKLTLGKYRKVNESIIIIEEAGKSTKALLTSDSTAPRLVLYSAEGSIAEAFIVSAGARVKIQEPSVSRAVVCLFATYYVWHCNYPTAYCNLLEYFDFEITGKITKNNRILKFIRDMQFKNKKNNKPSEQK
ncbi:uncharacterized protein LOC122499087 [Leptopilina heterotoma]|uniref:uncharacterized protein LOC122499087 n=1 Tax=Leptopilina heterotoma TaxID=63436 RepID=UPI001CA98D13|nr:uncharacterized protein LOC122499087 [Leptopilina heterotoma]